MGFLPLGLRVVMDRSYQLCSGIPGEHIFFKRVFLILRRCILTTLALSHMPHIYYAFGRSVTFVRRLPVQLDKKRDFFINKIAWCQ